MTPLEKITIDSLEILIKREDLNITGSHKDRYIPLSISQHLKQGYKGFVIPSTGNASISAITYCITNSIPLIVLLSPTTNISKMNRIAKTMGMKIEDIQIKKQSNTENQLIQIIFDLKPISKAIQIAKNLNYFILRGSTDEFGTIGYSEISRELTLQIDNDYPRIKNISNIFVPTSSGGLFVGIYEGIKQDINNTIFSNTKMHCVQTSQINTISREYDTDYVQEESIADAITDKIVHRYQQIKNVISQSEGFAWSITNKEIEYVQSKLKDIKIFTSNESAMSIAALLKAKQKGYIVKDSICIFTGTN